MMKGGCAVLACLLLMAVSALARAQAKPDFTPEEQQWIKNHPVVLFATEPYFPPIDAMEGGKHAGIVAEYLKAITHQSGLRFQYVPTKDWEEAQRAFQEGRLDLLPNVAIGRLSTETVQQTLLTDSYYATPTVIVTQGHKLVALGPRSLDGKAIATTSAYAYIMAHRFPHATIVPVLNSAGALQLVSEGKAEAAVGTEVVFAPMLRRKYGGTMGIAGSLDDIPFVVSMGVRRDEPLLYSVIRKSLGNLSTVETDQLLENALGQVDYGAPSLISIVKYRALELAVLGVFIVLLVLFAYRARVEHRKAEQSEMAKSRFLAIMSHEIRTPMNAVIASVEMLRRTPLDDRQQNLTSTVSTAAEALLGLLDDVLDLSKLDAKRLQLERIPTDVGMLATKMTDMITETARGKGLVVEVHVDTPPFRDALIDPTRFGQVLLNLLTNALKFTEHGSITVRVETSAANTVPIHSLIVQVIDTGIGISLEQQAGLFQAYTQADSSTTRRFGGTGLGLTICKELVELMGGHITLDSTVDVGTRIQFTLPVEWVERKADLTEPGERPLFTASTSVTIDNEAEANADVDVETILFVEDHPINQFVIGEQLKELGVTAVTVSDGSAALKAIEAQSFALVLMDCHMPGMDGYETARRIREREATEGTNHLPIIAVSAATDAAHQEQCMRSGMDGVLKKPLRMDELRGMLEMWIGPLPSVLDLDFTAVPELSLREALGQDVAALERMLDGDAVARLAHRLKGAAYVSGRVPIGQLAEQLETLVAAHGSGYYTEAMSVMAQIRAEVAKPDAGQEEPTLPEPSDSQ
jgi:two-component system sensor histidine kinase EvgS